MTKFNPKIFMGKPRVERSVRGNPGIYKIWVWEKSISEYGPPRHGNAFIAHRKRSHKGNSVREKKTFESLDQARAWRTAAFEQGQIKTRITPRFCDVVAEFKKNYLPQLRRSTQEGYLRQLDKYFGPLLKLMISEINPHIIDEWIEWLKDLEISERRSSFKHEFDLLSGIFKYYKEYDDDFESPLRPRHRKNIVLKSRSGIKGKFISEDEFRKFRACLLEGDYGLLFAAMATIQFFASLRISEVNAIHWEDFKIVGGDLSKSTLQISRSIFYSRKKDSPPVLQNSFKNSKVNSGLKVLPLFKESYNAFLDLGGQKEQTGLIFKDKNGDLFTYRQIQHAYDSAFKKAGLPFTGTHIMRHGGASYVYNMTNGDLSMVQAITGNRDYKSAAVYAHRSPLALQKLSLTVWELNEEEKGLLHKSPQS